jgi:hypothetical protein
MTTPKTRATHFRIDSSEKMPSGFLRVRGNLTKTGVFNYDFNGETVRELRPVEQVFRADSLDTLIGVPVTIDHPANFIGVENAAHLRVGTVIKTERADPYVEGTLQIEDAKAIAMVEAGVLVEVSLGYGCDPVEHCDAAVADIEQTNIVYNHAALGPSGWGRLGSDVSLRLDSTGNMDFGAFRMDALDIRHNLDIPEELIKNLTELLKK